MAFVAPLNRLNQLPEDPIFSSAKLAKKAGKDAINGTIGIILDEKGNPLIFPSIKKALLKIDKEDTAYPPLAGLPEYLSSVNSLVFDDRDCAQVATPGGTGAISALLRFAFSSGYKKLILPTPTWANHKGIASGMGFEIKEVNYLFDGKPSFEEIITFISKTDEPHILLLQAGCHNPTGQDASLNDWKKLSQEIKNTPHSILLDFPYQGIGSGVQEDAMPVKILSDDGVSFMVAWSASKNHCLYGLRCGCAFVYEPDESKRAIFQNHLQFSARTLFSVAPITGQKVVSVVQSEIKKEWEKELENLRELLNKKRNILAEALPEISENILSTNGMFLKLPLSELQVEKLYDENVFLTPDGRLNIAGVPENRIDELGSKISKYL